MRWEEEKETRTYGRSRVLLWVGTLLFFLMEILRVEQGKSRLMPNSRPGNRVPPWKFVFKLMQPITVPRELAQSPKAAAVHGCPPRTRLDFGAGPQGTELFGTSMLFAYKDFAYI